MTEARSRSRARRSARDGEVDRRSTVRRANRRSLGLACVAASLLACVPPCPDSYPLCVETTDAGCRAWSAQCCMGIVACVKGTTFAEDAGSCAVVDIPSDKRVTCN